MWKVYVLTNEEKNQTYVGATVDIHRRLRQHNSELSGGAKYTTSRSSQNHTFWKRALYVDGFQNKIEALQFEWALKYHSRKCAKKNYTNALSKRLFALQLLLELPQWNHVSVHEEIPVTL
jgi:putative endonuclease